MEEESEEALLRRKNKENKKINAARQRTQKRFETLLTVGSGSDDISESLSVPSQQSKKKQRTKSSDGSQTKPKKSPLTKRSRSQENLLKVKDDDKETEKPIKNLKLRKERVHGQPVDNIDSSKTRKVRTNIKQTSVDEPEGGKENNGFEESFNGKINANTDEVVQIFDDENSLKKTEGEQKKRKKKKGKQSKHVSAAERIVHALEKKRHDDGLLFCIVIHKTDQLKPDSHIVHPVVRVHIINMDTGQYVKKTDISRNVTSLHETKNTETLDYILPMLTQPFDFKKRRSFTPQWEETMLYNEMYSYFLQRDEGDPPVILFFEVLDFVPMNLKKKELLQSDKGWYHIGWAFLKLVSPTGATNTDKRCRLQLYEPMTRMQVQRNADAPVEIYQWWRFGTRVKYSSTLYVTIKGLLPPKLTPTGRSMFPTQQERGALSFEELNTTLEATVQRAHDVNIPMWTKMPGQANHVPNTLKINLPSGRKGCSAVRFSNNGLYLACACSTGTSYPVMVYEFPGCKLVSSFESHIGIVYDLCWLENDKELLSASADSTVRCWETKRFSSSSVKLFPHPSYVYTCKYHPKHTSIVITTCYDRCIRVWNKMSDSIHATLLREFSNHKGYVNSLTFSKDGVSFFSGDSVGTIIEWNCLVERKKKLDIVELVKQWHLVKIITLDEIKNVAISTLVLHPGGMKIMLHTKDSMIRMFDLRSYGILKSYVGGLNFKEHIHSCFSVCGTFIFCGAENGVVQVWNSETGDNVYTYDTLGYTKAPSAIHFHPHDDYIVFSCYADSHPINIYTFDPQVSTKLRKTAIKPLSDQLHATQKSLDETTQLYESIRTSTAITNDEKRKERIQQKLQSVTIKPTDNLSQTRNRVTFQNISSTTSPTESPRRFSGSGQHTMMSTWGSDFTYTQPTSPASFSTSPHAQQHLGSSGRFLRHGASPSPLFNKSPSIDMQMDCSPLRMSHLLASPKPVFTFNQPESENTNQYLQKRNKQVVSLYEYKANRADELSLQPNEIITVLYEDNANWWMGQLKDGKQGYFPANYVIDLNNYSEDQSFDQDTSSHAAVVNEQGELKIVSFPKDANTVRRSRKKKNERKKLNSSRDSIC